MLVWFLAKFIEFTMQGRRKSCNLLGAIMNTKIPLTKFHSRDATRLITATDSISTPIVRVNSVFGRGE
jgi:hypothetical protein